MRRQLFGTLVPVMLLLGMLLSWDGFAHAGGLKSDSKVKATATATKPGADGKQTVTITLDIEKGWYIYANPVRSSDEAIEGNRTKITVKAKEKVAATIDYPEGKQKTVVFGKETTKFDIYEGRVTVQAKIQRTAGDASPLQISIGVNACDKETCLKPGTIVLTVP